MKFIVNSDELGKLIQGLSKTVNGKSNLAILDHFLFEVNENILDVTASDGENMMKATVELIGFSLTNDDREKHFCIHSSMIGDFLKNISGQPITFDVDMDDFVVKISYQNGHIKFPCTAGSEYPVINFVKDDYKKVTLSSDWLQNDICRTLPFIGQEILRPVMNSICFNFENGFDVVSTNGNVLVKISHPEIQTEDDSKFLLPSKPATLLKFFLEKNKDVTVKYTNNGASFESENWMLTCRLLEGKYPNYNKVIPVNENLVVKLNKKKLQEAIRRMLPMGNQNMKTINLEIEPGLVSISCEDLDFNTSAKENIPCETVGETLVIGVNGEILYDLLSQVNSDMVKMKMINHAKPILVVPEEDYDKECFVSLVMPTLMN